MLSVFLPGPWAEDYRKARGTEVEPILKMLYDNRLFMEGLFEETDLALRHIVRQKLESHGLDGSLAHLVSFAEAEKLLTKNLPPQKIDLDNRKQGYTIIKGSMILSKGLKDVLAENGLEYDFPDVEGIKEFKGTPAFASGPIIATVQLLYTIEDVKGFKPGCILVAPMTAPDFLPAMKQAAAIITDEGGITCHAAIVSRELQKPCIIGTKIATKVLKDGDEVEVDATKGIVRILAKRK
jgi:phosphohistidine swiveling domain-containing protein